MPVTVAVTAVAGEAVLKRTSWLPAALRAIAGMPPGTASPWRARPWTGAVPSPIGPTGAAAPVVRSIVYRLDTPATVRAAKPTPVATVLLVATFTPGTMSRPVAAVKSSGDPFRVMFTGTDCVP